MLPATADRLTDREPDQAYECATVHDTHQQPAILKGDLASDFITYRFFFGFSDFRNSEKFNLWPLFEKEILPFCVSTGGDVPLDMWLRIRDGDPNPDASRGRGGMYSYDDFRRNTEAFAIVLPGIVDIDVASPS
jgi:hypothetical protein